MKKHAGMCSKVGWWLVVIGGLNWGLTGLGMLVGTNLNVVNLILGKVSWLEAIIYLLVGLSTVMLLVGCKACKGGKCDVHSGDKREERKMESSPMEDRGGSDAAEQGM